MWKPRKEDEPAVSSRPDTPAVSAQHKEVQPVDANKPVDNYRAEVAHIGKSVVVKGELSGSEDLYLDGEVEGSIDLKEHSLIVGPNGRIRANIHARDVVVHGKVDGNLRAVERVELKKTAVLVGDVATQRIIIEDGAFFKGSIDIQKEQKQEPRREVRAAAAGISAPAAVAAAPASGEPKKTF